MSDERTYVPSPWKMSADHVERYLSSGGADGAEWNGIPCVILSTIGRRSGALRRTPVVRVVDGDRYLVVGSMGGAPKHPQWYFNVLEHPEVAIHDRAEVHELRARVAGDDEYDRLWKIAVDTYPEYGVYQTRTERRIPVVICEPVRPTDG
jgi:deazaflavin-dependent oxidoreductase (nitroreductase family)